MSGEARKENYYLLAQDEIRFFKAFSSLIVPSGKDAKTEPGALEVGVATYIDSTLDSFPPPVQQYFRDCISVVDSRSQNKFQSKFVDLSGADKNIVLRELFLDPKTRERVFDLRSLALEGFYSDYHDPWYDGATGWDFTKFGGKRVSDIKKDWSFLRVWREWNKKSE
ncbi:MAG: gluconate 2-dehydrogenase subunit 3 family protein [Thaumarchaeota archaeon]|nr:gluconate 2-dehydrogenase subunit 3 family protein [Nitrososphaerota archaeon]MDG6905528.1 gluconate 2-dehydrogenase subunit 3 family protein [Nitrososphaerota archaeon]